jgi:predicted exporter
MGMIEDFGVVGLHESLNHPKANFAEVHRRVFPSVFWSAFTSALVFASLGLSVMPGIAQMGILTAIGILVGAGVMLYGFLPVAMRWNATTRGISHSSAGSNRFTRLPAISAAVLLIGSLVILFTKGLPGTNHGCNVLRPEHCEAFDALNRFQDRIKPQDQNAGWLPVILNEKTEASLAAVVAKAQPLLEKAKREGLIKSYYLPEALIPDPARQKENLTTLANLTRDRDRIFAATAEAGFNDDALHLSKAVFAEWSKWIATTATVRWPDAVLMEGMLGKMLHFSHGSFSAAGFVLFSSRKDLEDSPVLLDLEKISGVHPAGWDYLTAKLKPLIRQEVLRVCVPAGVVLLVLLLFVFRNAREIALVLGSLTFSGLLLLAGMSLLGIQWNFVNIGIVPLCLGLGLDFNIHMIYSLRRLATEQEADAQGIGRALAYCGLSTGLGFGALAMSGNVGLITFGQCSMIGVLATLYVAAFVVPWAWAKWR